MKNLAHHASRIVLSCLCLSFALFSQNARAATSVYYDLNGATTGSGANTGGVWEGNVWNLNSSGTGAPGAWVDGEFPRIAAGGDATGSYTITNNADHINAGMWVVGTGSAQTITIVGPGSQSIIAGQQGFFMNKSSFLVLKCKMTGPGGIIANASTGPAGQLFLEGNNDYTGGTVLSSASLLNFNNNNSFGNGGTINIMFTGGALIAEADGINIPNPVNIGLGTTLNLSCTGSPFTTTYSGNWTLNAITEALGVGNGTGNTAIISGVISGTGGIGRLASTTHGTLVLSGNNTYSGKTTIDSSITSVRSLNNVTSGTASSSLGHPTTPANGTIGIGSTSFAGTLLYTGAGETSDRIINLAGTTGGATIQADGTGPLNLTAANTTTGVGAKTLTLSGSSIGTNTIGTIVDSSAGVTAVAKIGVGTWILRGTNTYTGATTVSGGTLQIGTGGTTGNFTTPSFTDSATLAFNRSDALSTGAIISGTGNVNQLGAGTLTLTGANTYSGKTTIQNGALSAATLNSVASGSANSSLGHPTTAGNGTISIGSGATSAKLLYTGAAFTTDRVLDLAGTTGGATIENNTANALAFSSPITASGVGAKTLTLQGTGVGANAISAAIVDSSSGATSVTKAQAGFWKLGGTSSYTGATTISAGTLQVDGNITTSSGVTINGGTLKGNGIVPSVVINNTGAISPGASPGTLATGAETWNSGGSYVWEITDFNGTVGASWDIINADSLNIAATSGSPFTIKVSSAGSPAANFNNGFDYDVTILHTTNGINGYTAGSIVFDSTAFGNPLAVGGFFYVTVSGNDLVLSYRRAATISLAPTPVSQLPNTTATFTATGSGSSAIGVSGTASAATYQWSKGGVTLTDDGTHILGSTSQSLTIVSIQDADQANYTFGVVGVSSPTGAATTNTASASLTVVEPPTVSTPSSATADAGTTVTFSVTATGGSINYQWKKGGVNLSNGANPNAATISGSTSSILTLARVFTADVGSYTCAVTNIGGDNLSGAATLTVNDPVITNQPSAAITANAGSATNISVVAVGTTNLTYQWYKITASTTNAINGNVNGSATNATLSLSSLLAADSGTYIVAVTNANGVGLASSNSVLTVVDPYISVQPVSRTNNVGDVNVSFSVTALGTTLAYQWTHNGTNIDSGLIPSAATSSLTLGTLALTDAGTYVCAVTNGNSVGVLSSNAILTVIGVAIITDPANKTVGPGTNATFSITQTAGGVAGYQWYRGTSTALINGAHITGATTTSLTILGANDPDIDSYFIVATNAAGGATSGTATLTIIHPPVLTDPANLSVGIHTNAILSSAQTGGDAAVYQWYKSPTTALTGVHYSGATTTSLTIIGSLDADAGSYYMVATNLAAVVTNGNAATLTVFDPPVVNVAPASKTVGVGTNATFTVTLTSGTAPLSYQWRKAGVNLTDGGNITGSTTTALTITGSQHSDAGTYSVVITNLAASITNGAAVLTVQDVPIVNAQPTNLVVGFLSNAVFNVSLSSGVSPAYQWKKNGTALVDGLNITGATSSSLTVSTVMTNDAGSYTVVITNTAGSVSSTVATLRLNSLMLAFADGFETYVTNGTGDLDKNLSGGVNAAPNGSGNPWFGPKPGNLQAVTGTDHVATAHTGNGMVRGVYATGTNKADWINIPYRLGGGSNIFGNAALEWWYYAPSGTGDSLYDDYGALVEYNNVPAGNDYNSATPLATDIGYVAGGQRLSLGAYNGAVDLAKVNARIVGAADAFNDQGWFNTTKARATGWHRARIVLGAPNGANTLVSFYVDDMTTPVMAPHIITTTTGFNMIELNAAAGSTDVSSNTGSDGGWFDDVNFQAPSPLGQPSSRTNSAGTTATFAVTARSSTPISYQWQKGGVNLTNGGNITGATTSSLTITGAYGTDAGSYVCLVSDTYGSDVTSPGTLTVTDPAITTQPHDISVECGSSSNLTVTAVGTGTLHYQWYQGTTQVGGDSTSLTFAPASAANVGSYTVVVTGDLSSITSAVAVVSVADTVAPVITQISPGDITLQCHLQSFIDPGATASDVCAGGSLAVTTTSPVNTNSPADYIVTYTADDGQGNTNTSTRVVHVVDTVAPVITILGDNPLTIPLHSAYVEYGATAADACAGDVTTSIITNNSSVNVNVASTYTVTYTVSDSGNTTNVYRTVLVTDQSPVITGLSASQTNNAGTDLILSVTNSGVTPFTYAWQKDGSALSDGGKILGSATSSLTVTNIWRTNAGTYSVIISNVSGSVTSDAIVVGVIDPAILTQPASVSLNKGQSNLFTVVAGGTTNLHFQWYTINNAPPFTKTAIAKQTNASYQLPAVTAAPTKGYFVVVSNVFGVVTSDVAQVTFWIPPTIGTQPKDVSVAVGANVSLSVKASGSAPLSYQWLSNSVVLVGETTNSLVRSNVQTSYTAQYQCVVTNGGGSVTSTGGHLSVTNIPVKITTQPGHFSKVAGNNVVFTIKATGTAPLSYQWKKNGGVIGGEVGTALALINVQDIGTSYYSCVVSNPAGPVESDTNSLLHGQLVVLADTNKPTVAISYPASGARLTNGQSYTFNGATAIAPLFHLIGTASDMGLLTNVTIQRTFPTLDAPIAAVVNQTAPGKLSFTNQLTFEDGTNTYVVRSFDSAGNSNSVTRTFFYVNNTTMLHQTNNGSGTTIPVGSASTFDKYGTPTNGAILEIGRTYTIQAVPDANNIFTNWTDAGHVPLSSSNKLTFTMSSNLVIYANFATNPIVAAHVDGTYNGLFYETNGSGNPDIKLATAGSVTSVKVGTNGVFSGKLNLQGVGNTLSGTFDKDGNFSKAISRAAQGRSTLNVTLHLDWVGATKQITGTVDSAVLLADLASVTNEHPAFYTLSIPSADETGVTAPGGSSYATITNGPAGTIGLTGKTADGVSLSQKAAISKDGNMPLSIQLYGKLGLLEGWLHFTPTTVSGAVTWIKPATNNPATYVSGFTNDSIAYGTIHTNVTPALANTNLTLTLTDCDGLTTNKTGGQLSWNVWLNGGKLMVSTNLSNPTNIISGSVAASTGVLSVSYQTTAGGVKKTMAGVVDQGDNTGAGYLIGTNHVGGFSLEPVGP